MTQPSDPTPAAKLFNVTPATLVQAVSTFYKAHPTSHITESYAPGDGRVYLVCLTCNEEAFWQAP